jgi:hypothetical protein
VDITQRVQPTPADIVAEQPTLAAEAIALLLVTAFTGAAVVDSMAAASVVAVDSTAVEAVTANQIAGYKESPLFGVGFLLSTRVKRVSDIEGMALNHY